MRAVGLMEDFALGAVAVVVVARVKVRGMATVMTSVVGPHHRMVVLMTHRGRGVDGWRVGQCEYDCTAHEGQRQEVVCVPVYAAGQHILRE
jgi:hypothetical protein